MSVLINGPTLVIRRASIDAWRGAHWHLGPLGVDALATRFGATGASVTSVVADEHLVAVSYREMSDVEAARDELASQGVPRETHETHETHANDCAVLDAAYGPLAACDWVECVRHPSGYSYAWLIGTAPGSLAAPPGWSAPARPTIADAAHEPGRVRRLACENNIETWLDFGTGELYSTPVAPEEQPMAAPNLEFHPDPPNDLFPLIDQALAEVGWKYIPAGDEGARLSCTGSSAIYELAIGASAKRREIVCYCYVPTRVKPEDRVRVAELVTRINFGLRLGNFELDFGEGDIRYKTSVDVAEVAANSMMIRGMIGVAMWLCDMYFPAIQRVVFAGVAPEDAVRDVEAR